MAADEDELSDSSSQTNESSGKKQCIICVKGATIKTCLLCVECGNFVHRKCLNIVKKYLQLPEEDEALWKCNACVCVPTSPILDYTMIDPTSMPDTLRTENAYLKKVVKHLETLNCVQSKLIAQLEDKMTSNYSVNNVPTLDYLSAIKKIPTQVNCNPNYVQTLDCLSAGKKTPIITNPPAVLIIKSADWNEHTFSEIKKHVNPLHSDILINNAKPIKGGVIVNCENNNSLDKLKIAVTSKFGNKYSVSEPKKFKPRLLIKNVDNNTANPNEIVEDILRNDGFQDLENTDIKVVISLQRKYSQNVVIEVSASTRKLMIAKGSLFIGWKKCLVEDYIRVLRCFLCQRFGHIKKDCKSTTQTCPHCSEQHDANNCKATVKKCINCTTFNSKQKNGAPVCNSHSAADANLCFVFRNQIAALSSRINYGSEK